MFRAGNHSFLQQAPGISNTQFLDRIYVRTVALIGPSPARIRGLGNHRREVPQHMAELSFIRRDLSDPVHQFLIIGGSQADVVRKVDRTDTIVHAMNVILSVDIGNTGLRFQCRPLESGGKIPPLYRIQVRALGQDAAVTCVSHFICISVVTGRLDHL